MDSNNYKPFGVNERFCIKTFDINERYCVSSDYNWTNQKQTKPLHLKEILSSQQTNPPEQQ